jgi:hypothetical protein
MSNGFRITVAVISALGASGFFLFGVPALVGGFLKEAIGFNLLGLYFLCITLACLWESSRPVTLRIIGAPLVFGPHGLFLLITAGYPQWGALARLFYLTENAESASPG